LRRIFYNVWSDRHRNCTCEWAKKRSEIYQQLRFKFSEEQRYLVPLSAAMKEMKVLVGSFGNESLQCTPMKEDDGTYYHKPPQYLETTLGLLKSMRADASNMIDFNRHTVTVNVSNVPVTTSPYVTVDTSNVPATTLQSITIDTSNVPVTTSQSLQEPTC
jgi:hypothetical protein